MRHFSKGITPQNRIDPQMATSPTTRFGHPERTLGIVTLLGLTVAS